MKRKKIHIIIIILVVMACFTTGLPAAESEKDIFDRAKLALFDRQWDLALTQLNRLTGISPNSTYYPLVLFYKGKCHEEKKMYREALENYIAYLKISRDESFKEQANISIIDMNFALYKKQGTRKYLEEIVRGLGNQDQVVSYYAAFILSKAGEKTMASRAVPILKKIITKETDPDLVDRAKIALMRINPVHLKKLAKPESIANRSLAIEIVDKSTRKVTFTLRIPFNLGQLALEALPGETKKKLEEKGYNLEQILDTIVSSGEILKIDSEDGTVRIWID